MTSSRLASRPDEGLRVHVTPSQADWEFLTFRVHGVRDGQVLQGRTADEEAVLVLLAGNGSFEVGDRVVHVEDGRPSVFAGLPYFAYVPRNTAWSFAARGDAELAFGAAPAEQDHPARIVTPTDIRVEMRGERNVSRQISHLVDPDFGSQRLLCVEVYTPSGNWSSYPPHKHDVHDPPREVALDEIYYYRVSAPEGFAIQRLYGGGRDELVLARDGDLVLVREGYHPVVAAPGFDVYYLNVLAGDHPSWAAADDPDLAFVRGTWNSREPLRLPMGRA